MIDNTPVYSLYPADPIDPQAAEQLIFKCFRNEIECEQYVALPWCIEELVGSQWRNAHVGVLQVIERTEIGPSWKGGKIIPCFPDQFGCLECPGLWIGSRFVIEHWIRVDLLPLSWQLIWSNVPVRFHRKEIARTQAMISALKKTDADPLWALNRNNLIHDLKMHKREMEWAIQRMRQFASKHQLQIPLDLLNEGIGNEEKPAQLRLF